MSRGHHRDRIRMRSLNFRENDQQCRRHARGAGVTENRQSLKCEISVNYSKQKHQETRRARVLFLFLPGPQAAGLKELYVDVTLLRRYGFGGVLRSWAIVHLIFVKCPILVFLFLP